MSEETKVTQAETNSETNTSTQASEKNDVPYSRFQEQTAAKNDFKLKYESSQLEIAKMKQEKEDSRQEVLKKNEEYETLYNETNSELLKIQEVNKSLGNDVNSFREGLLEKLPEESRQYTTNMDIKTLLGFVDKETSTLQSNAGKTNTSRAGVTPTGEFGGYSDATEWAVKDPTGFTRHLEENVEGYIK